MARFALDELNSAQQQKKLREDLKKARAKFSTSKNTEAQFAARLKKIASVIDETIKGMYDGSVGSVYAIDALLQQYAITIGPWAEAVVKRMHIEVCARNNKAWEAASATMGVELKRQLDGAPVGVELRKLLNDQVTLIKSIPLDAAKRVHDLTLKNITIGGRPESLVSEILGLGSVTEGRARLIARTETARTGSLLTQARATSINSPGYFWETARDGTVRPSHHKLQGQFIKWSEPPTTDGLTYHAGQGPNCRCWSRPAFQDD